MSERKLDLEKIIEVLLLFANALEAAAFDVKRQIAELTGVKEASAVKEETFTVLKFEEQKGEKLGEFGVAHKSSNLPENWSGAYNILRQNNATIKDRYHGEGYAYTYWLFGQDKIFRQKRK